MSDVAVLGGNDTDVGEQRPDPGVPTVHIRLVSIFAGAKVKRRGRPRLRRGDPPLELDPETPSS